MVVSQWSSGQRTVRSTFGRVSAALILVGLLGACDEKESIDSGDLGVEFREEDSRRDAGPASDSAGQTGVRFGPSDEMLGEVESKHLDGVSYVVADSPEEANAIFDAIESDPSSTHRYDIQVGPCTLSSTYVYRRRSGGYNAIGFKPKTVCDPPVGEIRHESHIEYQDDVVDTLFGQWNFLHPIFPDRKAGWVSKLHSLGIFRPCNGTSWYDATTYRGRTLGIVRFNGKTYFARLITPPARIECGV